MAAAQERVDARQQLAERERLGEVVVGAGVEAGDAILDAAARGEDQDQRRVAGGAQAAQQLAAVLVGKAEVEGSGRRC
jgi:hypothetical protein